MEPRLQRRVQRYGWDKAALFYQDGWRAQLEPAQERLLEAAAPRPGEHVLDIACGTGLTTLPVARAVGPDGSVLGTDISENMVTEARRLAAEAGCTNAAFQRMDAEALTCGDAAFDLALCSLGLMYVPDPGRALAEMLRVLRPGGRALVLVWGRRANCGWAEIFPIVDARVESEVCPLFFQLGGERVLENQLAAAGFQAITTERFNHTLRFETPEAACRATFRGGPVALAYDRFDDPVREAVHREFLDSIAPYRSGGGYEVPGEFVLGTAVKEG